MSREPSSSSSADPSPWTLSISSNPCQVKKMTRWEYSQSRLLHGPEGESAVSMVFEGHVGGLDEVEVIAIPQIGLDDPPGADQGAWMIPCHGGAPASNPGSRTRLQAARASTNEASTRRRPRNRVCR